MSEPRIPEHKAEEMFEESLDESYPMVTLFGQYHYDFSTVLKRVDPILYREAFLEYWDVLEQELEEEEV